MLRLPGAHWLVIFSVGLAAQSPESVTGTISGTVLNAATGQAISGAQVILRVSYAAYGFSERQADRPLPADTARTITDEQGRFKIAFDPSTPPSRLFVACEGFRSEDNKEFASVALRGSGARNLTIRLTPQGRIRGHVYGSAGEALTDVMIQAIRVEIHEGRRELVRNFEISVTDAEGEYRLQPLPPGSYYLQAAGPARVPGESYGPVYFPAASKWGEASSIRVAPGETVTADFHLRPHKAFRIRGTLSNPAVRRRVMVRLLRDGEPTGNLASVNPVSGAFDIESVGPGSYEVQAYTPDVILADYGEAAVTVADHDVEGVRIALSPIPDVRGHIDFPGPKDLQRYATITANPVNAYPPAMAVPAARATIGVDGSFVLRNLLPGEYELTVKTLPNYYVESILAGAVDVQALGLKISSGKLPELKVTIRRGGGEIEGEVEGTDGPATILLVRRHGDTALTSLANAARGRFLTQSLAPGDYSVYAFAAGQSIDYRDPGALSQITDYATHVSVSDGERSHATVRVVPAH